MKVTVKYQILDTNNLSYGMFQENGKMIENKRITDEKAPLGGIASNLDWLERDVHCFTEQIKGMFPDVEDVEYVLMEEGKEEEYIITALFNPTKKQQEEIASRLQVVYWSEGRGGSDTKTWEGDETWVNDICIARVNIYEGKQPIECTNITCQLKYVEYDEFIESMCINGI